MGLKFSTPVFFWVEDLTVYFFGSEKSARIFWGSNFRQANSSYAIQAKVPARSESMNRIISSLVFFWVHNIRSMYFFGCKILGSVGPPPSPPSRLYPSTPLGSNLRQSTAKFPCIEREARLPYICMEAKDSQHILKDGKKTGEVEIILFTLTTKSFNSCFRCGSTLAVLIVCLT